jgi:hypothetical protein
MNYAEAMSVQQGSPVLYRGRVTEVLSISRTTQHALYFRLAGFQTPVNYASVRPAPEIALKSS